MKFVAILVFVASVCASPTHHRRRNGMNAAAPVTSTVVDPTPTSTVVEPIPTSTDVEQTTTTTSVKHTPTATSGGSIPGITPVAPVGGTSAPDVTFANNLEIDFTTMADGASLPKGLEASDDEHIGTQQLYMANNVFIKSGALQLQVPGGQTEMPYLGAEVTTTVSNIKHASVTTRAKFSAVAGTCHGLFFYQSDNAEIDIEYLTGMPEVIHYTNQKASDDAKETYAPIKQTVDLTADFHDYRIDWIDGQTTFYFDGILQNTFTGNVPTVGGTWI